MFRAIVILLICHFVIQCSADADCSQPPKLEDVKDCCKCGSTMREISMKCAEKYPFQPHRPSFCHQECVFNETGLAMNGVLQKDKAPAILTDLYKAVPDFVPIALEAMKKCADVAEAKLPKVLENKFEGGDACNPLPALAMGCFFAETFTNCPASIWENTESCNRAKEFMKSCPMRPHPGQ